MVKCVTCDLLFRNDNELDWHIRQEHLRKRRRAEPAAPPPARRGAPQRGSPREPKR